MSKLFTIILLSVFFTTALSQPNKEKVSFSEVVNVDLSKDDLFINAQTWLTKNFKDYKEIVQFEDKDVGRIAIKGNFVINSKYDAPEFYRYNFILTIECKDSRYRYTLSDIERYSSFLRITVPFEIVLRVRESERRNLEEFEKTDISKLKKKEKEEHLASIERIKESISEDLYVIPIENDKINQIIESLKEGMLINDDF